MMDSSTPKETRILASKELHSLSKTYTLLIRDIPFVTNISKLYDENILELNYNNMIKSKNKYLNINNQEIVEDTPQGKDFDSPENLDNPIDSSGIGGGIASVDENGLKADKSPKKYKSLDDEVFEEMQRQMHITDPLKGKSIDELTDEDMDRIITPEHKESIRKIE